MCPGTRGSRFCFVLVRCVRVYVCVLCCVVYACFYLYIVGSVVNGRIEEAEISDEERARMNDAVFQQMEHEVGIVMTQVSLKEVTAMLTVA
jgi:hypothetical protein